MIARIRQEIARLCGKLPVYDVRTLREQVDASLKRDRMDGRVVRLFGVRALLLTWVGVYGLIAYAVAGRTKEVGVRIALGAPRSSLLWTVLRQTLMLGLAGAVMGVPSSYAASGLLSKMLFGIQPHDPFTIAGAVLLLLLVGGVAGYLPARHAASVDPVVALRCE